MWRPGGSGGGGVKRFMHYYVTWDFILNAICNLFFVCVRVKFNSCVCALLHNLNDLIIVLYHLDVTVWLYIFPLFFFFIFHSWNLILSIRLRLSWRVQIRWKRGTRRGCLLASSNHFPLDIMVATLSHRRDSSETLLHSFTAKC